MSDPKIFSITGESLEPEQTPEAEVTETGSEEKECGCGTECSNCENHHNESIEEGTSSLHDSLPQGMTIMQCAKCGGEVFQQVVLATIVKVSALMSKTGKEEISMIPDVKFACIACREPFVLPSHNHSQKSQGPLVHG